jgi:hypothetical protein
MDHPATESVGVGMMRANTDFSEAIVPSPDDLDEEIGTSDADEAPATKVKRAHLRALRRKIKQPFEFVQGPKDVMGVVFMEVQCAKDLPRERNGAKSR